MVQAVGTAARLRRQPARIPAAIDQAVLPVSGNCFARTAAQQLMSTGPDPTATVAVRMTVFVDRFAQTKREELVDLPALSRKLRATDARSKHKLPLLKLATFGDFRTSYDCLRSDANVSALTGIEGDYDGERVSFDDACSTLTEARVVALLYTSPSHTEDAPRWRVLCPLSKEYPPDGRDAFMARLNGLFGGIFAPESWVLSQSYYFGSVAKNPSHRVQVIEGTAIDLRVDLDATAIGDPREQRQPAG
jgi:hypothetical protein